MLTSGDILTLHFFTWLSVACIIAYLLFRGHRSYLLYLGATFMCVTLILLADGGTRMDTIIRWAVAGVAMLTLIMAFVEGASDMKERLQRMREEQREREMAFADFQCALIAREMKEKGENTAQADNNP